MIWRIITPELEWAEFHFIYLGRSDQYFIMYSIGETLRHNKDYEFRLTTYKRPLVGELLKEIINHDMVQQRCYRD